MTIIYFFLGFLGIILLLLIVLNVISWITEPLNRPNPNKPKSEIHFYQNLSGIAPKCSNK